MALRPGVRCRNLHCNGVVRNGRCSVCGGTNESRNYDLNRPSPSKRGYDRTWQKLREMQLRREPLCRECVKQNILTVATDVDHIVPKKRGGKDELSNLQSLCHSHHSEKTFKGD